MKHMDVNIPKIQGKRVYVGLSGGVDSAVTAALLQKAGAKVTGVFIKGWYPPGMPCTWAEDRRDAMRVAARLRIPFVTLDAREEYKRGVIDYLLREYRAGRTPNPDIMCNREVKFGAFYKHARSEGADYIATGHYAQLVQRDDGVSLLRGIDTGKDQSYFLWAVPKHALSQTLFPLGALPKSKVRALAKQYKLPNAHKRDSQGICFLGSISVEEFLKSEFGTDEGTATDEEGREIGIHNGVLLHTIGERVALTDAPPGPWYVIRKDISRNVLVVSRERAQEGAHATEIALTETNWYIKPTDDMQVEAQYRYHGPLVNGTYSTTRDVFIPLSPLPEAIAAGQSLVLYDGEVCLGGGIIA